MVLSLFFWVAIKMASIIEKIKQFTQEQGNKGVEARGHGRKSFNQSWYFKNNYSNGYAPFLSDKRLMSIGQVGAIITFNYYGRQ